MTSIIASVSYPGGLFLCLTCQLPLVQTEFIFSPKVPSQPYDFLMKGRPGSYHMVQIIIGNEDDSFAFMPVQ